MTFSRNESREGYRGSPMNRDPFGAIATGAFLLVLAILIALFVIMDKAQ